MTKAETKPTTKRKRRERAATLEQVAAMTFGPPTEGPLELPIDYEKWMDDCRENWNLLIFAKAFANATDTVLTQRVGAQPDHGEELLMRFIDDCGAAIEQLQAVIALLKIGETRALVIGSRLALQSEKAA